VSETINHCNEGACRCVDYKVLVTGTALAGQQAGI
jgi:hypothetical protein